MAQGIPAVLVINAGSSSLRVAAFDAAGNASACCGRPPIFAVHIEERATQPLVRQAVARLATIAPDAEIVAVGHRVVHGGADRTEPAIVTPGVLGELESLVPLAPLHQPHNLAGIHATVACLPAALQVACFDTAFHRTCPQVAQRFALPARFEVRGIRRYGFHGLSYESIARRLPEVVGHMPRRVIAAHLGAGASLCGMIEGRSVATTMGFTPLDGLVMATRCGSLDPGVVLHMLTHERMDATEIARVLHHESGLLGVSGTSGDMRTLLSSDDPRAAEAVDLFCYRAVREIGSMAAAIGGVDVVVFTAGIGERSAAVRTSIAAGLRWLGLSLDAEANAAATGECPARISAPDGRVSAWVIPTQEQGTILRHTLELLARGGD